MSLLVALDFSAVAEDQLEIVSRLAKPNREIYLLHVAEPDPSFVGYEAGTPTRVMIDSHFKGLGVHLDYVMESSNIDSIKQLAVAGMGMAFLPEIAIEMELKQKMLKSIAIEELRIERPVTVYWKERRVLPRPAQMILKYLEERNRAEVPAGTANTKA